MLHLVKATQKVLDSDSHSGLMDLKVCLTTSTIFLQSDPLHLEITHRMAAKFLKQSDKTGTQFYIDRT